MAQNMYLSSILALKVLSLNNQESGPAYLTSTRNSGIVGPTARLQNPTVWQLLGQPRISELTAHWPPDFLLAWAVARLGCC